MAGTSRCQKQALAVVLQGIAATAFPADEADGTAIREAIERTRARFGPITVLHWNAFGGGAAGDLVTADPSAVRGVFDVAVIGLLGAVQQVLPDLRNTKEGAVLITNGAFGEITPQMDEYAHQRQEDGDRARQMRRSTSVRSRDG